MKLTETMLASLRLREKSLAAQEDGAARAADAARQAHYEVLKDLHLIRRGIETLTELEKMT